MKIIADDKIPFLRGVLEPYAEVLYLPGGKISPDAVRDADAILTRTRTRCDEALLSGSRVRFIATATIGMDHLDEAYLKQRGIFYTNAPGCNAWSVAQYIVAALTSLEENLTGKTLGIIGAGNVGNRVAAHAKALGMKVLLNDPPRAAKEDKTLFTGLDRLLGESDFVTLHVPLDQTTFHLADETFLRKMKPAAYLFNTSRGEVADGNALKLALRRKQIAGAVLDVWENEPDLDLDLLALVRFGTPHIAGYSTDGKATATAMSVQALAKFFNLTPLFNWQPTGLPAPADPLITAQTVAEAVRRTYDIAADDRALRAAPNDFEKLRGDYAVRREFPAYTVKHSDLTALGFSLLNLS